MRRCGSDVSFRIQDLPVTERPRERLLERGVNALSDRELLAIILRSGTEGKSALDLAEELLVRFGSWRGLASRTVPELCEVHGISETKAIELVALFGIMRRMQVDGTRKRQKIIGPEDLARLYAPEYQGVQQEIFKVINLTRRNTIISDCAVFVGTLTSSIVHPREVFRIAMSESAAAIILLHNHPSGDPTPSPADLEMTTRFTNAGQLLGIEVLDHVILGTDHWWSIREKKGG